MAASKNKLTPYWEGPFRVIDEVGQGAYKLESLEKKRLSRTWNAASLRIPITVSHKTSPGAQLGKKSDKGRS
ncbi:hypothetical protein CR513_54134, partial [Mucuna pruriens]